MTAYYNENDPKAAAWLRELIAAGLIAPGDVDERSIEDVRPADLAEYRQCHFFAGIGGWSYALRLAGWPDDRPVWTGSCPCQPFSSAARGRNLAKHDLWPVWKELIAAIAPRVVFGEQVPKRWWVDRTADDLEALGYEFGAAVLPAYSVGKDHARERVYFACHTHGNGESSLPVHEKASRVPRRGGVPRDVVPTDGVPRRLALRAFGNAIVPQVAAAFIEAYCEI